MDIDVDNARCLKNLKRIKHARVEKWLKEKQISMKAGLTNRITTLVSWQSECFSCKI
jgi:hypothetical protein